MSTFATEFLDLCPQTIVWKPLASRDAYGKPTYGTAQTFRGRRVYKRKRVPSRKPGSADVISDSQIIILGIPDVNYDDLVYVQGDVAPYPVILSIQRTPDEVGDTYVKVMMGNAE